MVYKVLTRYSPLTSIFRIFNEKKILKKFKIADRRRIKDHQALLTRATTSSAKYQAKSQDNCKVVDVYKSTSGSIEGRVSPTTRRRFDSKGFDSKVSHYPLNVVIIK